MVGYGMMFKGDTLHTSYVIKELHVWRCCLVSLDK